MYTHTRTHHTHFLSLSIQTNIHTHTCIQENSLIHVSFQVHLQTIQKERWLGLTPTEKDVYKASTMMRREVDERCSADMVGNIKGAQENPVPGSNGHRIPASSRSTRRRQASRPCTSRCRMPSRRRGQRAYTGVRCRSIAPPSAAPGASSCGGEARIAPPPVCWMHTIARIVAVTHATDSLSWFLVHLCISLLCTGIWMYDKPFARTIPETGETVAVVALSLSLSISRSLSLFLCSGA